VNRGDVYVVPAHTPCYKKFVIIIMARELDVITVSIYHTATSMLLLSEIKI